MRGGTPQADHQVHGEPKQNTPTTLPRARLKIQSSPSDLLRALALCITLHPRMSSPPEVVIAEGIPIGAPTAPAQGCTTGSSNVPVAVAHPIEGRPVEPRRIAHIFEAEMGAANPALPPPGAPPGGRYAEAAFFGGNSLLCCFLMCLLAPPLALLVPCFPCDRMWVYVSPDGSAWDPSTGRLVGY